VKYEILKYSNPGLDIKEAKRAESKQVDGIVRWLSGEPTAPSFETKRQTGRKGKTARRR